MSLLDHCGAPAAGAPVAGVPVVVDGGVAGWLSCPNTDWAAITENPASNRYFFRIIEYSLLIKQFCYEQKCKRKSSGQMMKIKLSPENNSLLALLLFV